MAVKAVSYLKENNLGHTGLAVSERWPTENCPMHWHEYIELELVLSGEGRQTFAGKNEKLSAGCLTLLRPTDLHEVEAGEGFHLLNFIIDDRLIGEDILLRLSRSGGIFLRLDRPDSAAVESLLRLIKEEAEGNVPDTGYLKHLIICLFLRLLRLVPESKNTAEAGRPIQAALLYLQLHFKENPSLAEAAAVAHYNPNHFSTAFHREMGVTYSQYLSRLKLGYAKELLLTTDAKVTDICFESGFTSHSNFLRLFKEDTGYSPTRFRNK